MVRPLELRQRAARLGVLALVLSAAVLMAMSPQSVTQGLRPVTPQGQALPQIALGEARTPIGSLPFTISSPGSYYVTRALTGEVGQSGITIDADDVTIDLNGFSLTGGPGSFDGITSAGAVVQNVSILNGSVHHWNGMGLSLQQARNCRIDGVAANDNGGHGIHVGNSSLVKDCTAIGNGDIGIFAATGGNHVGCVIRGCVAWGNASVGIQANQSLIANNAAAANGVFQINAGSSSLVGNHQQP